MEFMYCIPDLELFIDKTIKKCLLEYDLDANDTEAVLDDMEKAWPKTPPKEPEKQDHNGNTEVGRESRPGTAGLNGVAETPAARSRIIGAPQLVTEPYSGPEKSRPEDVDDRGQGPANGRRPADGDSDRSGCSSPDGGEGKIAAHKPTKLKSRLQQRYFEASQKIEKERSQSPVETAAHSYTLEHQAGNRPSYTLEHQAGNRPSYTPEHQAGNRPNYTLEHQAGNRPSYTPEHQTGYRPSNLDILASAVNLHTRREEENRLNALKNDGRQFGESGLVTNHTGPETKTWQGEDNKNGDHLSSQDKSSGLSFNLPPPDSMRKHSNLHPLQNIQTEKHLSHRENQSHGPLFTNTNNSTYKETVVVRREIYRDMKNPSSTSYPVLQNNLPSSMEYDQRYYPEASRYSFIPNAMATNQTSEIPKALPQQFQDHGSRIARIIAEELQKDEECPHRAVLLKNAPLVQRINPDEMKQLTLMNTALPNSNTLNHSQYLHNNERANNSGYFTRAASNSLPLRNDNSFSIYPNKTNIHEDNQPQDLSLKSKESSLHRSDRRHLTSLLSSPTTPIHGHLTKGYFSSPNSPIVPSSPLNHVEPTSQRKSASPTVSTESRPHAPAESSYPHRTSGHWDRKEHVLRKNPGLAVDSNLLRDLRRSDALQNWSGVRHSELEKRRGNNTQ